MTESAADMARLMNVVEAIVAEMERQGVAGAAPWCVNSRSGLSVCRVGVFV